MGKARKESIGYSIALSVVEIKDTFDEDSYDKSTSNHVVSERQLANIDIAGLDLETLKTKLHSHIELI